MKIHICVFETEQAGSSTSVEGAWPIYEQELRNCGCLGSSKLILTRNFQNLDDAFQEFQEWTCTLPSDEPILFWVSIRGLTPKGDDLVGTSGWSDQFGEVHWFKTLTPAIHGACRPSRILVLMDVCWGASPTAPARLSTPASKRPYGLIGPRRSALRNELDSLFEKVVNILCTRGLPCRDELRAVVDELNLKYQANDDGEFCRFWTWNTEGTPLPHPKIQGGIRRVTDAGQGQQ